MATIVRAKCTFGLKNEPSDRKTLKTKRVVLFSVRREDLQNGLV
jgi:hypothetical protein